MISIVIPTHNENIEKIDTLLRSIDMQRGINFEKDIEIILCTDVEKSFFENYSFSEYKNISGRIRLVKSYVLNNIGMNRQSGIDSSLGEYVFFCDADDSLYNFLVIRTLIDNIEATHADLYSFDFIEEVAGENGKMVYAHHDFNYVWVFAKAYKVEFLRKNNITFSSALRYHEDNYFNFLFKKCDPVAKHINAYGYIWCYSRNSITRLNNNEYSFTSWSDYLQSCDLAIKHCEMIYKKDCTDDIIKIAVESYDVLHNSISKRYIGTKEYDNSEFAYYNFLKTHMPILWSNKDMPNLLLKVTNKFYEKKRDFFPNITWYDHVKLLQQKYKGV